VVILGLVLVLLGLVLVLLRLVLVILGLVFHSLLRCFWFDRNIKTRYTRI